MKKIRFFILILCICTLLFGSISQAQEGIVVSLGANLSEQQRSEMLQLFKVEAEEITLLTVTNQEERDYLEGLVSEQRIGTRAISSAMVEPLQDGAGITVETYNIDWVTKEMIANAMVTAGLQNARVVAAAPFAVSGTAALTGIIKAFEEAAGEDLSEEAKQAANEELVTTGELGEDIGKDQAVDLLKAIKERIIKEQVQNPDDIRRIILEIAAELNINLTKVHLDQLVALMERISKLDLNVDQITKQLENITGRLDDLRRTVDENRGLLQRIIDSIQTFFQWLAGLFGRG